MKIRMLARHLAYFAVYGALGALLAAIIGLVVVMQARPDLEPWHRAELDEEFTAESDLDSLADYLALEERLFDQLDVEVYAQTGAAEPFEFNRYKRGSLANPDRWPRNWNRSFEWPHSQAKAVALLLHGLSDSPYSMRNLGERLHAAQAHVFSLRIPGHGTAPSGLTDTDWRDMAAAVELAVADLDRRFPGKPLHIVGYSNGAALALNYALDTIEDGAGRRPDRLVLISPEIAVTGVAAFAAWQARLGHWLGLEKLEWNELSAEYDPFKYGSFAINAATVSHEISVANQQRIARLAQSGQLANMPPVLAFSSVVDATVRAPALVSALFNPLPPGEHELVLFDINRRAGVEKLLKWKPDEWLAALETASDEEYRLTLVSNEDRLSRAVLARSFGPGDIETSEPLALSWPEDVYSLSHVALPFPETDPLYGGAPLSEGSYTLGNLAFRGERGVLQISDSAMLRQRWNPFYSYLEERMLDFLALD